MTSFNIDHSHIEHFSSIKEKRQYGRSSMKSRSLNLFIRSFYTSQNFLGEGLNFFFLLKLRKLLLFPVFIKQCNGKSLPSLKYLSENMY
jgi:hypothetical protein